MSKPRVAVTMGDPAGIGPEICLCLLHERAVLDRCHPVIFGDDGVLRRVAAEQGARVAADAISPGEWHAAHAHIESPVIVDVPAISADVVQPGKVDPACGNAAFRYIEEAIEAGLRGEVVAVSTGPINKAALHAAGHFYPGHTEIFAEKMAARRSCMMLTSPELTCSFATVHVGYHEVPGLLTTARIVDVIELTADAMRRIRGREPRLSVCGLNPHAGEGGLFGNREEELIIVPAIELARSRGIDVEGPLPADTAFLTARRQSRDAFVCMYHDQGHIPLKALAFDSAINTTLGLPVIRTSVDHGTAFDIAWKGIANPNSLFEAVLLAVKLTS